MARYQWEPPIFSESVRKDSSPESGSGPSPSQPMMTGRSWRWMAARRLTPSVSAWMWCMAPAGSRYPTAARRSPAARGVRVISSAVRPAAAPSSGR